MLKPYVSITYVTARGHNTQYKIAFDLSEVNAVETFVARTQELKTIHRMLDIQEKCHLRFVILAGMGGIGKTQLAISYCKQYGANYSSIFWMNAKEEITLKQSYVRAAERIWPVMDTTSQEVEKTVGKVKRWFNEQGNSRWLIIYDNYDYPKLSEINQEDEGEKSMPNSASTPFDIKSFLPNMYNGSIIVTSRRTIIGISGHLIRIKKLTAIEDSLNILATTSKRQGVESGKSSSLQRINVLTRCKMSRRENWRRNLMGSPLPSLPLAPIFGKLRRHGPNMSNYMTSRGSICRRRVLLLCHMMTVECIPRGMFHLHKSSSKTRLRQNSFDSGRISITGICGSSYCVATRKMPHGGCKI